MMPMIPMSMGRRDRRSPGGRITGRRFIWGEQSYAAPTAPTLPTDDEDDDPMPDLTDFSENDGGVNISPPLYQRMQPNPSTTETGAARYPQDFPNRGNESEQPEDINNICLNYRGNLAVIEYRVDFCPIQDNASTKKSLIRSYEAALGCYIFDVRGRKIYTTKLIPAQNLSLQCQLGTNTCTVTFGLVGPVCPDNSMYLKFYDLVLRKCMNLLGMEQIGRKFYFRNSIIQIQEHNLEIRTGFSKVVLNHEVGLQVAHKIIQTSTVLERINSLRKPNMSESELRQLVRQELIGVVVVTQRNNKTYRIDDVDFNTKPSSSFRGTDGVLQSFADYYRMHQGQTVYDMDQPMLVSIRKTRDMNKGINEKVYLVPSLCCCTGITSDMRKNCELMTQLSQGVTTEPLQEKKMLEEFMHKLQSHPLIQNILEGWKVGLKPSPTVTLTTP